MSITTMAKAVTAERASGGRNTEVKGLVQVLEPPPFQPVQLANLVDTVPTGDRWLHEMKYDGYRLLVAVGGGTARAYTRSGLDWSEKFASITKEAAMLGVGSALLDGEAVVMDEKGRSSFQALQGALKGASASIDFVAFDLLELNGEDLTNLPLTSRKAKLREIVPEGTHRIRYSEHIEGNGEKLLHRFCSAGLEGVISKKVDGRYIGSRSGDWLKTKCIKRIAPLVPQPEWPEVKSFAHRLAQAVAQNDPDNFTAALPKVQRKGRIFVDYLRNQRGATAVMPYSVRARSEAPVAAPITWREMETIDAPNHFHIGDVADLVKRAGSKTLAGWGRADQTLPDL